MEEATANLTSDIKVITRLEALLDKQKAAFLKDSYPSAATRIERMKRVPPMLRKYRSKIHKALNEDFGGHSAQASDLLEILGMFDRAAYNIANVKKWMKPIKKAGNIVTFGNARIYMKSQPKGVIGNMVSWNFPFDIALGPLLDALGAGNRMIIKPSDLAPASGAVLEEMIKDTFEEDLVAVVNGGLELAKHFPTLKWDHLVYTGSGRVGKLVMKAAAENLVPVTLELGGKSPVIISEDAITDETIASIAGIKAVKRGQMCVTGDYVLAPANKMEEVAARLASFFKQHFSENDNGASHTCGIITKRHQDRLEDLIADAADKGAEVIAAGEPKENHMPFHVVVNPPADAKVMQEEIFGPILPVLPYESVQGIIDHINADDHPLGLYIYSRSEEFVQRITENTQSGGVAVNVIAIQAGMPALPFGGVGGSGMGVHHGEEGFREFSNQRGYFWKGSGGRYDLLKPPYSKGTDHLIEEVAYAPLAKQAIYALKKLPGDLFAMLTKKG